MAKSLEKTYEYISNIRRNSKVEIPLLILEVDYEK